MADEADRANDAAQWALQACIAQSTRALQKHRTPATGACLWCDEPTAPGLRWCGAECRDAWQHYESRT